MATHPVISTGGGHTTAHKLVVFSWSFFFIWIGIALLSHFGWGVGLLGVGIIILGKQATRKYVALGFETFEVVCGALFVLGGVWELLSVRIGLVQGSGQTYSVDVSKARDMLEVWLHGVHRS